MTQQLQAPQPPYAAPAPAKKPFYKKAWFLVVAAIAVIAVIASQSAGGSGDSGGTSANGGAAGGAGDSAPAVNADATIGQPARDGKFEFVVQGIDCSRTEIGSQYMSTTAQGTFCVVDLTVSNIGNEPQSFFGENTSLFNAQGQEFSADTEAAIYLDDSSSLYEEINPGNMVVSKVVFDVPAGTVPTSIELHDSSFSGGVTVSLQ
ncbi:DUF4352 domain-containing protein [Trujillonella humicola]|uniref:DUF4352 domain-containing protein n=1 Tax=Trujillonella humicola TaxID=3383699 RepID=UPI003906D426